MKPQDAEVKSGSLNVSDFKDIVAELVTNWDWKTVRNDKYIKQLIFTCGHTYRKDMKISQFSGDVKFKFKRGAGPMGTGVTCPRFCVSRRAEKRRTASLRVVWIARCDGWCGFQLQYGSKVISYVSVHDMFVDPLNITDEELVFVEMMHPRLIEMAPTLREGFADIHDILKRRFSGF